MIRKVLLSGGTGFVGTRLTTLLLQQKLEVYWLVRDIKRAVIPQGVTALSISELSAYTHEFEQIDVFIHLAGANIGEKRWTDSRKQEILNSRVLLPKVLAPYLTNLQCYVSASGISIYPPGDVETFYTEYSEADHNFLAEVVREWEGVGTIYANKGARCVYLRTGVVIGPKGGMLAKVDLPAKMGLLSPFGNGEQLFSWIHLDDLVQMYWYAIMDEKWSGIYNAVAPEVVTNKEFTIQLARAYGNKVFLPAIPAFLLRLVLGEMAALLLSGNYVDNYRIRMETNFKYKYPSLTSALVASLKT